MIHSNVKVDHKFTSCQAISTAAILASLATLVCRKEVNSIAVHPSGRLALSVSADSTLRLWNLVKGKSAHESTLPIPADQVAFSPSGKSFAMVQGTEV